MVLSFGKVESLAVSLLFAGSREALAYVASYCVSVIHVFNQVLEKWLGKA